MKNSKKILVIEDNKNNMYLIKFILEKNGYEVIGARNAINGIKLAIEKDPDLIIMDIQLPDIDGLETTRRIKSTEKGSKIPVIAVTSYAMTGDREKALSAGCDGYIEKPINPETIAAEIEKHLSGSNKGDDMIKIKR
jgi:two-component system cell cycle response regulator DivK